MACRTSGPVGPIRRIHRPLVQKSKGRPRPEWHRRWLNFKLPHRGANRGPRATPTGRARGPRRKLSMRTIYIRYSEEVRRRSTRNTVPDPFSAAPTGGRWVRRPRRRPARTPYPTTPPPWVRTACTPAVPESRWLGTAAHVRLAAPTPPAPARPRSLLHQGRPATRRILPTPCPACSPGLRRMLAARKARPRPQHHPSASTMDHYRAGPSTSTAGSCRTPACLLPCSSLHHLHLVLWVHLHDPLPWPPSSTCCAATRCSTPSPTNCCGRPTAATPSPASGPTAGKCWRKPTAAVGCG